MTTKAILYIVSLFFLALLSSHTVTAQTCHLRELDLCAATLLVLAQNPGNPTGSDGEIDRQCSFIREADDCLRNFTDKCATPLQRELIDFISLGGKQATEQLCTSGTSLRNDYKKHAKCLGEARKESKECAKDLQAAIELMTDAPWDNRITFGCCAYNRFQRCSSKSVKNLCGSKAVEVSKKLIHMATSRLPEMVCSSFKESKCADVLPPPGNAPKGTKSALAKMLATYLGS